MIEMNLIQMSVPGDIYKVTGTFDWVNSFAGATSDSVGLDLYKLQLRIESNCPGGQPPTELMFPFEIVVPVRDVTWQPTIYLARGGSIVWLGLHGTVHPERRR